MWSIVVTITSQFLIELGSDTLLWRVGVVTILTGAFLNDDCLQIKNIPLSEMIIIVILE